MAINGDGHGGRGSAGETAGCGAVVAAAQATEGGGKVTPREALEERDNTRPRLSCTCDSQLATRDEGGGAVLAAVVVVVVVVVHPSRIWPSIHQNTYATCEELQMAVHLL